MIKWIYLIIGGIVGTASRYSLAGFVQEKCVTTFPWGTLSVNLIGCLIVGFLDVLFEKKFLLSINARILLMTGFCGAFTTFSTLILETSNLIKSNQITYALGNILISFVFGFAAFKLGAVIAEFI
ncbi:MAG: fluoride efflux transporter CrcB [Candidatus Omnitrophica bacterium]|nr:fluoride efflux transporter CrcB [Candidatus Omnitrophota bacterium]